MKDRINLKMILGQSLFYIGLITFIGYFAESPSFENTTATTGEFKLIVRHSGKLLGECRKPDPEVQKKLPRNMRIPMICPRERSPVAVRLLLDDREVMSKSVLPAGYHNDGVSALYRNFQIESGKVHVKLVINDSEGDENSTYTYEREFNIKPSESVALEFSNGFTLYKDNESSVRNDHSG